MAPKTWSSLALYWWSCALRHRLHCQHLQWCRSLVFSIFLFRHVHVRTAVGTACGTKKTKPKCAHFGTKMNEKDPDKSHTQKYYTYVHITRTFLFFTCLYVFSFCPANRIIVSIMYVYYIRTFRECMYVDIYCEWDKLFCVAYTWEKIRVSSLNKIFLIISLFTYVLIGRTISCVRRYLFYAHVCKDIWIGCNMLMKNTYVRIYSYIGRKSK